MIKQILTIVILLIVCNFVKANDHSGNSLKNSFASPAVRNSIKFNYDLLGNNTIDVVTDLSDDFNIPLLRPHWKRKLNETEWTLKERPGYLRIKAQKINNIEEIQSDQTFSHLIKNNTIGEAVCLIDVSSLTDNTSAGLYYGSSGINFIGVQSRSGSKNLIVSISDIIFYGPVLKENTILFRFKIDISKAWFEYSIDGTNYTKLGDEFKLNTLKSDKNVIGFYCLNSVNENSSVDIDWFYYNPKVDHTIRFAETGKKIFIPEI